MELILFISKIFYFIENEKRLNLYKTSNLEIFFVQVKVHSASGRTTVVYFNA